MRTATTSETVIPHPLWCRAAPDGAPYDPDGGAYDRLAPAEDGCEHRGRLYRLEVGDCFSGSVEVRVVQTFEFSLRDGQQYLAHSPKVRLVATNEDAVGALGDVYLSLPEADRLCEMLQRAKRDLALAAPAGRRRAAPSWAADTSTDSEGWSYWSSESWCFPEGRMQVTAGAGPSGQEGPSVQLGANFDRPLTSDQAREVARELLEHADRADRG